MNRSSALAMSSPETVGACVTTPDDDHVLALGSDEFSVRDSVAFVALVLQGQVVHREVDALEVAPRNLEIPGGRRAARQHQRMKFPAKIVHRDIDADVTTRPEHDAFIPHDVDATVEKPLLHLELGNAISE